jgi:hypothetical protein
MYCISLASCLCVLILSIPRAVRRVAFRAEVVLALVLDKAPPGLCVGVLYCFIVFGVELDFLAEVVIVAFRVVISRLSVNFCRKDSFLFSRCSVSLSDWLVVFF